jgi:hypothetical protein
MPRFYTTQPDALWSNRGAGVMMQTTAGKTVVVDLVHKGHCSSEPASMPGPCGDLAAAPSVVVARGSRRHWRTTSSRVLLRRKGRRRHDTSRVSKRRLPLRRLYDAMYDKGTCDKIVTTRGRRCVGSPPGADLKTIQPTSLSRPVTASMAPPGCSCSVELRRPNRPIRGTEPSPCGSIRRA